MLKTIDEVINMVKEGKVLHIAADEKLLTQLPCGNWIGGTTQYFMSEEGGCFCQDKLFVTEIEGEEFKILSYKKEEIYRIAKDSYENGFTFLLMPHKSEVSTYYAQNVSGFEDIFLSPIVGWICGADVESDQVPKVFDGRTASEYIDRAIVMHVRLPENKMAYIGTINIFELPKQYDKIEVMESGYIIKDCLINGEKQNIAEYYRKNDMNPTLPLVGNYSGTLINVGIEEVTDSEMHLYAPAFRGITYTFPNNVDNYEEAFHEQIQQIQDVRPLFSCNCYSNYTYGKLENVKIANFEGPVTMGEIAYQQLGQTLVYLEIREV